VIFRVTATSSSHALVRVSLDTSRLSVSPAWRAAMLHVFRILTRLEKFFFSFYSACRPSKAVRGRCYSMSPCSNLQVISRPESFRTLDCLEFSR
jgi:hypothetical protein